MPMALTRISRTASSTHWALIGVAGSILIAASALLADRIDIGASPLLSAAVMATGLGAGFVGCRFCFQARDPLAAFDILFDDNAQYWALSDSAGTLVRRSAALGEMVASDARLLADALATFTTEPQAMVYRLTTEARHGEYGKETVYLGDQAIRITVRPVSGTLFLWLLERNEIGADSMTAPLAVAAPVHAGRWPSAETIVETLPVAIARLSADGTLISLNAAARGLLGSQAVSGTPIGELIEGLGRSMDTRIAEALRGDGSGRAEIARAEPDGHEVFLQVSLTRLPTAEDDVLIAVLADATELKTLEQIFVQSQKMQAVGQLAGGVAHDFNNLLTAISGHNDLLLQRHHVGDADYADLIQVQQNANRAAALVRQLLAFSRKQTLKPRVVSLPDVLGEVSHLLNRLLGERISLRIENEHNLHPVKVDERQFEQVIMNLVVNARDAMADGGTVTLRSYNTRLEVETRRDRAVMPRGDYVRLDVIDTGSGIPPEVRAKIFEPFFTTKKQGEGTGLGLSTVYGIIKQTGGFIFVESIANVGTTFSIYLPRSAEAVKSVERPDKRPAVAKDQTGHGVVLLIEDEAPVRAFGARALKMRGYEVLEAASAEEALVLLDNPELSVDVLVSDVVMPGMDGPTCVRKAREQRPDVRVVFVSGYAEEALRRSIDGIDNYVFLSKPFTLDDLTTTVKECVTAA